MQDRWSAQRGAILGPKAALLARGRPGGGPKWPQKAKIGLKRAFFRGTAKIPPKYAKNRLLSLWGAFVLVKRRRAHCAGFNTSTSGVQRKSKHGKRSKRPRRVGPVGQLFSSQATQCSYKYSELSILVFTITQVNIYRHPIKLIQGKQSFSPPILVPDSAKLF